MQNTLVYKCYPEKGSAVWRLEPKIGEKHDAPVELSNDQEVLLEGIEFAYKLRQTLMTLLTSSLEAKVKAKVKP